MDATTPAGWLPATGAAVELNGMELNGVELDGAAGGTAAAAGMDATADGGC